MTRNKVVQVPCDDGLYKKIKAYRDEKGLGKDAAAARDLILFALRIIEHSDDDEGISTRELLEAILSYSVKAQYVSSLVHYQVFNEDDNKDNFEKAKEKHKIAMDKSNEKIELILSGGGKEV